MNGQYWHSECLGCSSYGNECETGCEYSDIEESCKSFTPIVSKFPEYSSYTEGE